MREFVDLTGARADVFLFQLDRFIRIVESASPFLRSPKGRMREVRTAT